MRSGADGSKKFANLIFSVTLATVALSILAILRNKRSKESDENRSNAKSRSAASTNIINPEETAQFNRDTYKESRRLVKIKHLARKKPMYDNVLMFDLHREILCTISKKKAQWYINKGLAKWLVKHEQDKPGKHEQDKPGSATSCDHLNNCVKSDNRLQIQLLFEPKNRSNRGPGGLYVRSEKKNICVVCGSLNDHMRHYIVPYAYRTLLPERFKSHLSHDIIILCPNCRLHVEQHRQRRMNEMEDACRKAYVQNSADYLDEETFHLPFLVNHESYKVRSSALALLQWKSKLPKTKVKEYETIVRKFLREHQSTVKIEGKCSAFELTQSILKTVSALEYKIPNDQYIPGAELVIAALGKDDDAITEFICDWRRHFLAVAQPRFMPTGWSVNSPVVCGED